MTKETDTVQGALVLGNQLFPETHLKPFKGCPVFMAEDWELCTVVKHHQQKIVMFLAAMREYAERLRDQGFDVDYQKLGKQDDGSFEERLAQFVKKNKLTGLVHFEIEDHFFAKRIDAFCHEQDIEQTVLPSPMFLTSREQFSDYLDDAGKPAMAGFYRSQRQRLELLVYKNGKPKGGQWSFDEQNRKKLPAKVEPPELSGEPPGKHTKAVIKLVASSFSSHPGEARDFWWPVTRDQALDWMHSFVEDRLENFGTYQDAISTRSATLFHSVLSPSLNLGLITPDEVVEAVTNAADKADIPMNSLEGFIRQLIGWREFIRGIYHHYDEEQRSKNFWNHHRGLTDAWYTGETGIAPLDQAIKTAIRLGWTHHIDRLMVVGNLMNLCEIEPTQVHDWFMQTHVDSSDWVMGPNVYGMALYSDGGIFATKPYIAGSNYLRKMSDFGQGDWCDIVDGLYWRFVDKHSDFMSGNHRLSMMVKTLERMKPERRERLADAAEAFLDEFTVSDAARGDQS